MKYPSSHLKMEISRQRKEYDSLLERKKQRESSGFGQRERKRKEFVVVEL